MDLKCPQCGKLVARNVTAFIGEFKCNRCKKVTKFKIVSQSLSCCIHK